MEFLAEEYTRITASTQDARAYYAAKRAEWIAKPFVQRLCGTDRAKLVRMFNTLAADQLLQMRVFSEPVPSDAAGWCCAADRVNDDTDCAEFFGECDVAARMGMNQRMAIRYRQYQREMSR